MYPNGNKVPAALLKQGLSFLELKDKTNASLILKELTKKYPEAPESKMAQSKLSNF
jgi:TolA-binding protein